MQRSAAGLRVEERRGTPPPARGTRFLQFASSTYDADAHTVEAILSTGAQVNRGFFIEELQIAPDAISLDRVAQGQVKLLDSHNAYELGAVLGKVDNARTQSVNMAGQQGTTLTTPIYTAATETDTSAITIKATATDSTSAASDVTLTDFLVEYLN